MDDGAIKRNTIEEKEVGSALPNAGKKAGAGERVPESGCRKAGADDAYRKLRSRMAEFATSGPDSDDGETNVNSPILKRIKHGRLGKILINTISKDVKLISFHGDNLQKSEIILNICCFDP